MIKYFTLVILKFFDFFHQKKILNFLKKKGFRKFEYIFDVGAHKGETINLFVKNFQVKEIYSFEPSLKSFNELKLNAQKIMKSNKNTKIF